MTPAARCSWWARWWHQRRREADLQFMLPAFIKATEKRGPETMARLWQFFTVMPGQEHWRCPCSETAARNIKGYLTSFDTTVIDPKC